MLKMLFLTSELVELQTLSKVFNKSETCSNMLSKECLTALLPKLTGKDLKLWLPSSHPQLASLIMLVKILLSTDKISSVTLLLLSKTGTTDHGSHSVKWLVELLLKPSLDKKMEVANQTNQRTPAMLLNAHGASLLQSDQHAEIQLMLPNFHLLSSNAQTSQLNSSFTDHLGIK